jgi:hypothetical protein
VRIVKSFLGNSDIKRLLVSYFENIALSGLGLIIIFGVIEILFRAFPQWVPDQVRVNPPTRRVKSFEDISYDFRLSDGDLFHWMEGAIAPIPPEEDVVLARVHMITDSNGFRNPPKEKSIYHIIALGDSFTKASGVPNPWTQKLAEATNSDVLNLSEGGFGPQDELKVLQQYGLEKQPQWVILAYFGGNDLYDAAAYEQANPFILTRFVKYMLTERILGGNDRKPQGEVGLDASNYRYPITVSIRNSEIKMAFFSYYISWLSVSREMIAASQNYQIMEETVLKMKDLSEAAGARFLLVYIPSKENIYLQYIRNRETLESIFSDVPSLELDGDKYLQFSNQRVTPERTFQFIGDQAHLLGEYASEHSIGYLDLTPVFQETADNGVELYYPYDTHWNQIGHNLAASAIANYISKFEGD